MAPRSNRSNSSAREKPSKISRAKLRDGIVAPYVAYAVAKDGSRRRLLDARKLVIDVGPSEFEIDLSVPHRIVRGRLSIRVWGKRGVCAVVLGPGDGNGVWVDSADGFGDRLNAR
jgi:hypothetical protein